MRTQARFFFLHALSLPLLLAACSSADPAPASVSPALANADAAPDATEESDAGVDAAREPTASQRKQADAIGTLVHALADSSAWHEPVDADAVATKERKAVLEGDGTNASYVGAAWRVMNAFPQGHQGLYAEGQLCGREVPLQSTSRFGVCGRPVDDGVIVTYATANNRLGLNAGDVVVRAGNEEGKALLEASYLRPQCGSIYPALSGRLTAGAATFFGNVPANTALRVRAPNGTTRDVTVPATLARTDEIDCTDPFARDRAVYAEAKKRPDGVAVIRLPSFFPFDKSLPNTVDGAQLVLEEYQAAVAGVFDTVKDAPAIIWDARGNTGGFTPVALAIVGGFPSARETKISYCQTRTPKSSPPAFAGERYAEYLVTKGGAFAYSGKVAIVTDGLAYSAGDYFPFAALKASDAIVVGTSTAGAYGGGNAPIALDASPALIANYDPTACFDQATNLPLEGNPPSPTIAAAYDPAELASGKDSLLERAAAALLQ